MGYEAIERVDQKQTRWKWRRVRLQERRAEGDELQGRWRGEAGAMWGSSMFVSGSKQQGQARPTSTSKADQELKGARQKGPRIGVVMSSMHKDML